MFSNLVATGFLLSYNEAQGVLGSFPFAVATVNENFIKNKIKKIHLNA